jgi:hypothetical protein
MKLTIIVDDQAVYKDKVSFDPVDLSGAPSNVHALQFDTTTNTGHIEFKDGQNQTITSLPDWAITASNNYDTDLAAYEAEQAAKLVVYLANKGQ